MRSVPARGIALILISGAVLLGTSSAFAESPQPVTGPTTVTTDATTDATTDPTTVTTGPPTDRITENTSGEALPAPLLGVITTGPTRATPQRGTQVQVADTLPPPPTTTTTTTTLPDWVLPADSGTGRRVVYSKAAMRVWTVETDGTVSRTYLVSGRTTWDQPLPGTYSVFSRSSHTCSIKTPTLCWRYMVRFTKGPDGDNIGFHEIPIDTRTGEPIQDVSQLGTALSGGCVRQATPDAQFIWGWAGIGTKVVVLG